MNHIRLLTTVLLLLIMAGSANAFDCQRKGIVAGLGGGYAPLLKRSGDDATTFEEDGALVELQIGYAWDDRNMVLLLGYLASHEEVSEYYTYDSVLYREEVDAREGFIGVVFRRFIKPEATWLFVQGGLGGFASGSDGRLVDNGRTRFSRSGPALLVGGGVEPARHLTLQANFTYGKGDGITYTALTMSLVCLLY